MSAQTLQRAAALMRERAHAAGLATIDRPWGCDGEQITGGDGHWMLVATAADASVYMDDGSTPVAAHIASWHPAVAFAVADWLDIVCDDFDNDAERTNNDYEGFFDLAEYELGWFAHHPALAVAYAYLGEAS